MTTTIVSNTSVIIPATTCSQLQTPGLVLEREGLNPNAQTVRSAQGAALAGGLDARRSVPNRNERDENADVERSFRERRIGEH
jgi:hypothetical protein